MKKILLSCGALALISTSAFATDTSKPPVEVTIRTRDARQSDRFYVRVGVGYNFAISKMPSFETTANTSKFKGSYFGQGFDPGVAIGYKLHPNVAFELGFDYYMSSENSHNEYDGFTTPARVNHITSKANALFLKPAIRLSVPLRPGLELYTRTGVVLPLTGKITYGKDVIVGNNTVASVEQNIYGRFNAGLTGGIGLNFRVSRSTSVYLEATGQALVVWAKESEITKYHQMGQDVLSTKSTYELKANYVKDLNGTSNNLKYNNNINPNAPRDESYEYAGFHSAGIKVGLQFKF